MTEGDSSETNKLLIVSGSLFALNTRPDATPTLAISANISRSVDQNIYTTSIALLLPKFFARKGLYFCGHLVTHLKKFNQICRKNINPELLTCQFLTRSEESGKKTKTKTLTNTRMTEADSSVSNNLFIAWGSLFTLNTRPDATLTLAISADIS